MIPTYRVIALCMGQLIVNKSSLTYRVGNGEPVAAPIWSAAIEGNGHRIVVDTGIADRAWVAEHVSPCTQEPDESIAGALAHIGWEPQSVDIVVNTHLHYDHCGGNRIFPSAALYVSAREWEHAATPIATQAGIYDRTWLAGNLSYFSYRLTTDHFDIVSGIRLLMTPGHTPGHQSVLVNTSEGILAVAGDAVKVSENLKPGIPPGILHDTAAALASIQRIRMYADRFLASHDSKIAKYQDRLFPPTK